MESKRETTIDIGGNPSPATKQVKGYKSEYKKNFLPFSQYDYIDGKFFKKKGSNLETESPWYKEVIELRQKAGEYKFRGWGTELGTTVVVPAFNHQLWKHVSHKSSFNALALITTTSRGLAKKDSKSKDNSTTPTPGSGSKPAAGIIRRPHTATPKHPLGASEVDGSSKPLKEEDSTKTGKGKQVKPLQPQQQKSSQNKARSQSAEPGLRYKRNLPSKQAGGGGGGDSVVGGGGGAGKGKDDGPGGDRDTKTRRPTTLSTSPRSRSTASSGGGGGGSRDQSKSTIRQHFNKGSVDRSLDGTYDEVVVKSPPEPTRVKSPEQVKLKSPDPVNWMVPLDTTRGFTVTQSLPKGPVVGAMVGGA